MDEENTQILSANNELKIAIIEQLRDNPIISYVCKKVGIGRATYYRWKETDPEFDKEVKKSQKLGRSHINDLAESQLVSLINEKYFLAIKYWLAHNHDKYKPGKITLETTSNQTELPQEMIREIDRLFDINRN
jgi:hypothetical protein